MDTNSNVNAMVKQVMIANGHQQVNLCDCLCAIMNQQLPRCTNKRKAEVLVDHVWSDDFINGEAQSSMIDKVWNYVRTHIFSPWRFLKAMDLAGFNLSLAGIEVFRGLDHGDTNKSTAAVFFQANRAFSEQQGRWKQVVMIFVRLR